jgi:EmrB/QacA subfamily drug resistance transporter
VSEPLEHAPAADSAEALAAAPQPWGLSLSRRRIIAVVAAVMMAMLLSAVDQTVVGTALPRIIADLNGLQHYAWVATAYLLASTASMPIWGKLSDAFGRKRFFIIGMVIFVVGSALCGQSHNMTELILFRAFQGLGAGAMLPITQAIIGDIFPPAKRAKYAGLLMSVFAVATIIGPLLGGWLTDNASWRWCFYVNLPVGIAAIVVTAIALPGHLTTHKHRIDYGGAALLVAAAVPLLLGFSWAGSEYPWGSWQIVGLFVFAAVMTVVFIFRELRAAEPVINPRLFENRVFSVSALASALQSAAMFGAIMFLPLFVQGVQGKSATNSGIILMPLMIGAMITSIGAGQILARTGRYKVLVIVGFVLTAAGAFLLSKMGVDTSGGVLTRNMVLLGLGLGIAMSSFTVIVQNQYPSHRLGEVTAGLQFFRSIGSTIGMAIFGTILTNQFAANMKQNLPAQLAQAMEKRGAAIDNPQVLLSDQAREALQKAFAQYGAQGAKLFAVFMDAVRQSLAAAIDNLFLLGMIIGLVGLAVVLFLPEIPLRKTHLTVEQEELLVAEAEAGFGGMLSPEGAAAEAGQDLPVSERVEDGPEPEPEPAG